MAKENALKIEERKISLSSGVRKNTIPDES